MYFTQVHREPFTVYHVINVFVRYRASETGSVYQVEPGGRIEEEGLGVCIKVSHGIGDGSKSHMYPSLTCIQVSHGDG